MKNNILENFIGKSQMAVLKANCRGEEGAYFKNMLNELTALINKMPRVYAQDDLGDDAIVYLHYFKGSVDAYVTERDTTDEQYQAFGYINLGHGGELGYICIKELIDAGCELDLHWKQKTLKEIKEKD